MNVIYDKENVLRAITEKYADIPFSDFRRKGILNYELDDLMWMIENAPIPKSFAGVRFDEFIAGAGNGILWSVGRIIQYWTQEIKEEEE